LSGQRAHVLIIGAGAAGSAAAIWCSRFGLRTVLVEAARFPRERPGEALVPAVETLLEELGVGEAFRARGFLRFAGSQLTWGQRGGFFAYGQDERGTRQGFQVPRRELDLLLRDEAVRRGVHLLQPCAALGLFASRGRLAGAVTSQGPFRADFVIDAGGPRHWLARKMRLPLLRHSPTLHVRYGYAQGSCPERDEVPLITAEDRGWRWVSRILPGVYQWTRLSLDRQSLPPGWMPPELAGLRPACPHRGADMTWRQVEPLAGPGYFLVGDSAAVFDPSSLQGVVKGLMSAMKAAHAIHRILNEGADEEQARREYCHWFTEWFHSELQSLRQVYLHHPYGCHW
jgi:flavin-dependent dehydrogenase